MLTSLVFAALTSAAPEPPTAPAPRPAARRAAALTLKHPGPVRLVAASRDRVATAQDDGTVTLWDAATGAELQTVFGPKDEVGPVTHLRFTPDGAWLLLVTHGGRQCHVCECRKPKAVQVFARSPLVPANDRWKVSGIDRAGARWLYEPSTVQMFASCIRTDAGAPAGETAVIADTRSLRGTRVSRLAATDTLTVALAGGVMHGWPAANAFKPWAVTLLTIAPTSLALSNDGAWIALTGLEGEVRLFDATTGRSELHLRGHRAAARAADFSPAGDRLVTGGDDRTARVWDVNTGRELVALGGHAGAVLAVAFAPDGGTIVTGSGDKTAKVWELKK